VKRVAPPSGQEPPHSAQRKDGTTLDLDPLAREVCDRYFQLFPDHIEHYGAAGDAWCVHDSLYLFAWAIDDVDWDEDVLIEQVLWLASVLSARDFPVPRLGRHLELAAAVARLRGDDGLASKLVEGAEAVASWVAENEAPSAPVE
jgi:hypothetical protein